MNVTTHKPLKILVVDDQAKNLLAMQALLETENVQVLTADSGRAALELLLAHEVALALLDVQMPEMDGYALAELMRGNPRTRLVPIIFVTAVAPDEQRSFRGYEAGAVDFLYKPIDTGVLRSKVAVFVELCNQRLMLAERSAELERVARLNALMIGVLSHDIRTPLAVLALNAELISRRSEAPGLQQAGTRIKAATAMASRQVDHLLNLARLPAHGEQPQLASTDLHQLLLQRLDHAEGALKEGGQVSLTVEGDASARLDPALISQALEHLLLLAASHSAGRPVHIELDGQSRQALVLRLRLEADLPESAQPYLFGSAEPRPGLAVAHVGPGLDLPERIARAHGGSLIVRSSARDGTLFELLLPRDPA